MRGLTDRGDFRLVAVTRGGFPSGEAAEIERLLRRGWWRVHIRKPGESAEAVAELVGRIPAGLRPRLSLHDHFELAGQLGVGGVHLNFRNPEPPAGWRGMVSWSCHSLNEVEYHRGKADYMFLSPIFDSISKPGYQSRFTPEELEASRLLGPDVFALGGVVSHRLERLRGLGFGGAAMLGAAWMPLVDEEKTGLQFITDRLEGLEEALKGGCRWVQLRMKEASDEEFVSVALPACRLCHRFGAEFIVDDRVHLVNPLNADGVHIGKNDMPVADARRELGPVKIIGATANTPADALAAVEAGADYLGVGPFRFTTTKKLLAPLLGGEGIRRVVEAVRSAGSRVPIVAIGGIETADLPEIRSTGVTGVAVSGLILNSEDKIKTTKDIIHRWKN